MHLNSNSFAFGRKNRENASTFFINLARQRTSTKMCLNFTANSFIFGHTNCEIVPKTFSVKLAGRQLPKCVCISRKIPSFLDANILKMHSELFFVKLQGENLQNASGLQCKQLRFCMQKSWKCAQHIFANLEADNTKNASELHGKQLCCETLKLGNCAQISFTNFASREFLKCVWTFYAVTWEQLQSWKSASLGVKIEKKIFSFWVWGFLRGTSQVGVFLCYFGHLCLALGAVPMDHFLDSKLSWKLGQNACL